jgi:hypothetical protein
MFWAFIRTLIWLFLVGLFILFDSFLNLLKLLHPLLHVLFIILYSSALCPALALIRLMIPFILMRTNLIFRALTLLLLVD